MNLELGKSQYWENYDKGKSHYWVNFEKRDSQCCGKLVTAKSHHWAKFETVKSQIGKKRDNKITALKDYPTPQENPTSGKKRVS